VITVFFTAVISHYSITTLIPSFDDSDREINLRKHGHKLQFLLDKDAAPSMGLSL
jgi:hypothetical protein